MKCYLILKTDEVLTAIPPKPNLENLIIYIYLQIGLVCGEMSRKWSQC